MAQKLQISPTLWHGTDLLAFKGTASWKSFSTPKTKCLRTECWYQKCIQGARQTL